MKNEQDLETEAILTLLRANPQGLSCGDIAKATEINYRTVFRRLAFLVKDKQVAVVGSGKATRYTGKTKK